jgi:hypothetical protein
MAESWNKVAKTYTLGISSPLELVRVDVRKRNKGPAWPVTH